jgi:predicted flap endonuclease-1-like 5' DNA nuclease
VLWFIGQSLLVIAAAFLLGLLVGWLVWGLLWRRARVDESAAVTTERARHSVELADRDAELVMLRQRVAECDRQHAMGSISPAEPRSFAPAAEVTTTAVEVDNSETVFEQEAAPAVRRAPVSEHMSMAAVVPTEMAADNLERIEGIGPQMSGALLHAGIRTYAQLAAADETILRDAIEARGLRFAPSLVTWSRQAQLLADGNEAGFTDLTRRLVAGRDEGRE